MNKKEKYPPEYLFWKKRIEGQIRHTMYEHPEFFTEIAYGDNLIGRMAKRIIGEIIAGISAGDNYGKCATGCAFPVTKDGGAMCGASSGMDGGSLTAIHHDNDGV